MSNWLPVRSMQREEEGRGENIVFLGEHRALTDVSPEFKG